MLCDLFRGSTFSVVMGIEAEFEHGQPVAPLDNSLAAHSPMTPLITTQMSISDMLKCEEILVIIDELRLFLVYHDTFFLSLCGKIYEKIVT